MDLYLFEDILQAESSDDLLKKTQRVVEKLEYETFIYGFRYLDTGTRENKLTQTLYRHEL